MTSPLARQVLNTGNAPPRTFVCQSCGKICKTPGGLTQHEKRHSPFLFKCHADICWRRTQGFYSQRELLAHLEVSHPDLPDTAQWHQCDEEGCDEQFSEFQTRSLELHKDEHRRQRKRRKKVHGVLGGRGEDLREAALVSEPDQEDREDDEAAVNAERAVTTTDERHRTNGSPGSAGTPYLLPPGQTDTVFEDHNPRARRSMTPHYSLTPSPILEDAPQPRTSPPVTKQRGLADAATGVLRGSKGEDMQLKAAKVMRTLKVGEAMQETGDLGGLPRVSLRGGRIVRDVFETDWARSGAWERSLPH